MPEVRPGSGMRKGYVRKIIAFVIVFNFIQIGYYLLHRAPEQQSQRDGSLTEKGAEDIESGAHRTHQTGAEAGNPHVDKIWLQVPSYTPWVADSVRHPPHSCEAYFGHGFTDVRELVQSHGGGSFRCHFSETLRASVCEGTKMVMHPLRIRMAVGGEEIDAVIGRNEEEEMPVYREGAFEIEDPVGAVGEGVVRGVELDAVVPRGQVHRHGMRSLVESIRTVKNASCSEVITRPTLFVTRFEYANLFHTVTDWYMTYVSSRVVGLENRPMVVLLDGHCKSPMDDGWETFFNGVKYAKHFGDNVCFEHAIFVPLGYDTALFKSLGTGLPCTGSSPAQLDPSKTARLREFGEEFSSCFTPSTNSDVRTSSSKDINVLFIRREDYLAHPRHSGKPETRLTNEEELYKVLVDWSKKVSRSDRKVTIFNGLFAHMRLGEQIKAVQTSSVILGVHGAGLTHIVCARPNTAVLEILSPLFMRPHYQFISQWMGVEYQSIVMDDTTVDTNQVVEKLNQIISNLYTRNRGLL